MKPAPVVVCASVAAGWAPGAAGHARGVVVGLVLAAQAMVAIAGCTSAQRDGLSPAYVIVRSLQAASGASPDSFSSTLDSDVVTNVEQTIDGQQVVVPTVYEDPGQAVFSLALKDPGSSDQPTQPSTSNFVTITRYHVQFVRADGRRTPGVDVPYPFDGALTTTVSNDGATGGFTLVRVQAKQEAPLRSLVNGGGAIAISTIAEVTFYGADQAGHVVVASGRIGVNFADWGDPR